MNIWKTGFTKPSLNTLKQRRFSQNRLWMFTIFSFLLSLSFIGQRTAPPPLSLSLILMFLLRHLNFFIATLRELVPRLLRRVTLSLSLSLFFSSHSSKIPRNKPYLLSLFLSVSLTFLRFLCFGTEQPSDLHHRRNRPQWRMRAVRNHQLCGK